MLTERRAIGIVRVSEVGDRDAERFASPDDQRERIANLCDRENLRLVEAIPEMDVSGGAALERRPGLRRAIEDIEAGNADVLVVAYFDRLVRSLRVQQEIVERVEAAGGRVLTADVGQVSNGSAAQWLSGTLLGAVNEYQRRSVAERVVGAQKRAVEQGRPPFSVIPGLRRTDGGVVLDENAPAVAEAFRLRAEGATILQVREHLRGHGIERSYTGVKHLLASRLAIGEIVFGNYRGSCPALIDGDTWRRVQRTKVPRGRKPKSERLLARLGVLRCGNCGSRMAVGMQKQGGREYPFYRCGAVRGECERGVTISAPAVEEIVTEAVKARLADVEGRASAEQGTREAADALARAQAAYDAAIRILDPLEPAAVERLAELRQARDEAQERMDRLGGQRAAITVKAAEDWDRLTVDERRALIRATVAQVVVAPGRGPDRVSVEFVGE